MELILSPIQPVHRAAFHDGILFQHDLNFLVIPFGNRLTDVQLNRVNGIVIDGIIAIARYAALSNACNLWWCGTRYLADKNGA